MLITCCIRGAVCWSDYRLVHSKMNIRLASKQQSASQKPPRKLNICSLPIAKEELQRRIQESLPESPNDAEEEWSTICDAVYTAETETLDLVQHSHKEMFDENDLEIGELLDTLHKTHQDHISNKNAGKKTSTSKSSNLSRKDCARWKMMVGEKVQRAGSCS